jgi:long-chain-fatty-acid--CoA ligase ACSBG
MQHSPKNIQETSVFRVTDPKEKVQFFQDVNDLGETVEPLSVPALMKKIAATYPNHNALMYKDEAGNDTWRGITYKEYRDRVEKIAKVFIKLGLERHGTVAVLAFNSVEWFVSELAAIHAG